ncbi:Cof-type HAD-IIB family hydrolase [Mycoplasma crocodyli]|uniref:COF family haloacid dehalogenase(HAD)-like hydrolase n=1 Tax=Mycoplasma crocodyli (strain ATCC 51981 / MP145) TaxID=512564 RepID=D5E5T0_MYCCM|nr:HAD family hydrolase [Mycoplasma crocodyli]ADE19737.1 COF family haloacid dehalogenase(HAD)-like hydrolase [Mycoplasma crocodyli MP145]
MKKWAIFSDVDGTIYGFPDKKLLPEVKSKISELKVKNIPFVINTGNAPFKKIQKLADELHSRYIVCASGAVIYDNLTKEYLHIEYIDKKIAQRVFDVANKHSFALYYFGINQYYMHNHSKEMYDFLSNFCEYNEWILDGKINEDIHKIEFYGTFDEVKKAYEELLKEGLDKVLNIMYMGSHIEIVKHGVDKGTGMKWLCDNIFDIKLEDVMSIGDSANDIGMFDLSGYSYAMDNSDKNTKSKAKYHAPDVHQAGIAYAIDDYLYRSDYELKKEISQKKK